MRIRLRLIPLAGVPALIEMEHKEIHLGRSPECEIHVEDLSTPPVVSRRHARIDLDEQNATLTHIGSSNATYLNNQPLNGPRSIRPGDRIRLGATGPTLEVMALVPSMPAPAPAPEPEPQAFLDAVPVSGFVWSAPRQRQLLIVGAAAMAVFLLALSSMLFAWSRWNRPRPVEPLEESASTLTVPETPPAVRPDVVPGLARQVDTPRVPVVVPPPPKEEGKADDEPRGNGERLPITGIQAVGTHLRPQELRPAVLVQRQGEKAPWTIVRPHDRVSTGATLVAPAGYECLVTLDSGVRLTLWGTLPDFGPSPLLEAVAILNVPATGVDADIILDRGRIQFAASKAGQRVRLRFLSEVWDVHLGDADTRICIELGCTADPETRKTIHFLDVYNRGKVRLVAGSQSRELDGPSRLRWSSLASANLAVSSLESIPEWWSKPPSGPDADESALALADWATYLDSSREVLVTLVNQTRESSDRKVRLLGLLFLAGLDEPSRLLPFLNDRDTVYHDIRATARLGLQDWLARNPRRRPDLVRLVRERETVTEETASRIVDLLGHPSLADLDRPMTYQKLIDQLDDEQFLVRVLASCQLYQSLVQRVPAQALRIAYSPVQGPAERRTAVDAWRKAIPPGSVPPPPK